MDSTQVLFVGAADGLWTDLSRSIQDAGLTIVRSRRPASGLDRRLFQQADTVILGPEISGVELLDLCREIRSTSRAAITVISEELDEIDEMRLIVAGACTICFLPVRLRVLAAQLANRIEQHAHPESGDVLIYQGLQVRSREHLVTVDGRALELTKTEFALLSCLMGNPRRVYTHSELSRWLWDDSWEDDHHRLEAHVCRLRKKVIQAGGPQIIGSVRGVGYRLINDVNVAEPAS